MWGHLGPSDLHFIKLGKASKPSGSEEDFIIFFYVFLWLEPTTLARSHLGPWDPHLNKIGKEPLGNASYQISSIEAK